MKSNMIKRIIPLLSAVTAAALLSGCSIFLYDDESSAADLTTTASKTERNRSTTTKKIYIVDDKDDVEYTTTAHKNSSEDIDPDALERVSVATTKKKDKDKDIVLTTTTTAKPSAYNILHCQRAMSISISLSSTVSQRQQSSGTVLRATIPHRRALSPAILSPATVKAVSGIMPCMIITHTAGSRSQHLKELPKKPPRRKIKRLSP